MTIGERIRQVRKENGLSLDRFGACIGLKQAVVSLMENGKSKATDQTILSICREFGIREAWLRTGEGPMKDPEPSGDDLDACLDKWGLPREFRGLFVAYRNLKTDEERNAVCRFIRDAAAEIASEGATPAPETARRKPWAEMTKDEKLAELSRQLDEEEATRGEEPQSGGGATA